MKKSYFTLLGLVLFLILSLYNIKTSSARVYFLEKNTSVEVQKNERPCPLDGYKVTLAECMKQGLALQNICPTDSRYGKSCSCDQAQFQYTTSNCAAPKSPIGNTCNGKYKSCDCDPNVYRYYTDLDCPTNKTIDANTACTYVSKKVGYSACACSSQYSETCTGNLEGVGEACDGKYKSCKCKSNFVICSSNKGATGASSCTDSEGTKYTSCQPAGCPAGTVDASTYWDGKLSSVINVSDYATTTNGKTCVTLPSCETFNFNSSRTCAGQPILRCPFDLSKIYCHYN